jgi:hypothetical protein
MELEIIQQGMVNARTPEMLQQGLDKGAAEIRKITADADLSTNTMDLIVENWTAENLKLRNEIDNVKLKGELMNKEMDFIGEQIAVMYHRLNLDTATKFGELDVKRQEATIKQEMNNIIKHVEKMKLDQRTKELIINNIGGIVKTLLQKPGTAIGSDNNTNQDPSGMNYQRSW